MAKHVLAVRPYRFREGMQFLTGAFEAWKSCGGDWMNHTWKPRFLHYFIHRYSVPFRLKQSAKEAHLMFISSSTLKFNTFADYVRFEVIPMIWDCWPYLFDEVADFIVKNNVRTAVFTSSMTAKLMKERFPELNVMSVTEGIDIVPYSEGKLLKDRTIDLLEFGRSNSKVLKLSIDNQGIVHKYSKNGEWVFPTNKELYEGLADSKVSLTFPRCDTHPEVAGNIETLTQRYWECMLSRVVMVGRAPFELVNLLGYDPVLEIENNDPGEIILDVLRNPDKYQPLVDKNRAMALKYATWHSRIVSIRNYLISCGYEL